MNKLLILLVQVVAISSEYEVRCPVSGEWRFRYRKFNCSRQKYVCLLISPENIYNETCDGPDYSSSGSKLIFQPFFFNKAGCKYNRYQPFAFSTNGTSDCVFEKSLCNEEGQILFNLGSVRNNIACGCNFSTGFRFVTKPKNNCFCIPSEEDCSCYKPTCYSKDNQCHYDDIDVMNISCSDISTKPIPKNDKSTPVLENGFNETQYIMDNHIKGISNRIKLFNCFLAALIGIAVTFSVCFFMAKTSKCSTRDYSKRLGRISIEELNTPSECGEYFCKEHRKKHKREDIENTWLKHAGNVSCIKTGNFQLHSVMSNGTACKRIKQNFSCLKQTLVSSNVDKVMEKTYRANILAYDIYKTIKNVHGLDQQVEYFLKRVSETDENRCLKFLKLLTRLNLNTEPGKAIPKEKRLRYQSVTKEGLRKRLEEMKDQLEIKNTLDLMIEYDVITVRDHDDIQRCKRQKKKVEAFINCVFRKEHVDWIPTFLYVLEHRGYSSLADALSGYRPISPFQGLSSSPGHSVRVDIRVAALPVETKRCLLENYGDLIAKAVRGVFKSPILNLRQEPLYFFYNISKDTLFVIQQNATRTLSSLVNKMLHSKKVKGSIAEKTFVLVEIDETDAYTFLNQNFGYIEKTIIMKYDSVFNDIETNIIVKTLKEEERAPDFFQHKSIDIVDSLSRIERIGLFLRFVLTRESILEKIMHLLNDLEIDVERQMDSSCSGIPVKSLSVGLPKNRTFEFQVHERRYGHIIVELVSKDSTYEGKVQQHEPSVLYQNKEIAANKDVQLVAAIDIGTSYSGYAYSTVDEYRADHLDITCNQSCKSGRKQTLSSKTPSCILMKKNKELVSTGYDAENDYEDIIEDGNEEDYLFFEQFKLPLHTTMVSPEKMVIEDIKGNQVAAIDVFASAIKALKNDLEQHLTKTYTCYNLSDGNIKWVLTLPGLWTVSGKELMRKSAEKIGITGDQLSFVREPDAASVHYLNKVQLQRNSGDFTSDNKFMIINIGGGSFDVSAYERIQFNQLRTLCSPSGGPYGGTTVNTNFLKMLTEIVGPDVLQSLKREHTVSFLELNRKIEAAKRDKLRHINTKKIYFTFPLTIFNDLCNRFKNRNFMQLIEGSKYKNSIAITDEKIGILKETMNSFFSSTIREIETEIRRVFRTVEGMEKTKMLFVGGFADSEIVRDSISESFPKNELVFSKKSDLIVLMGAVSHGYQPHVLEKIPSS